MNIAALVLTGGKIRPNTKRKTFDSLGFLGLNIVIKEIESLGYNVDYCTAENMYLYDIILFSITAPEDITTFIKIAKSNKFKKGNSTIIVGGAGCINICSIYDYIDVAVFGRAEGLARDIISINPTKNIWVKSDDPNIEKKYEIRQVERLDAKEGGSCGCKNKCFFCQYSWTRKLVGDNYNPGVDGETVNEEDFKSLSLDKPGRYTTGIDGLSEYTRKRVNKGFVTDDLIRDKCGNAIANGFEKAFMLKFFGIVGYPWETKKTALKDTIDFASIFNGFDKKYNQGRLMGAIHLTPFSPEPLTPMEHCPANVEVNWRRAFGGKSYPIVRNDRINIFIGPYTTTEPTLIRRVLINRCKLGDREKVSNIINSNIDGKTGVKIKQSVLDYLGYDPFGWKEPGLIVPYLYTYCDYKKIGNKFFYDQV
jgi:hypothetical protein